MGVCCASGCGEPARWSHDGRPFCGGHVVDAAIRSGRPAELLPAGELVSAEPEAGGPGAVWDELERVWETVSIDDGDAVAELVSCLLDAGKAQAMELERLRSGEGL